MNKKKYTYEELEKRVAELEEKLKVADDAQKKSESIENRVNYLIKKRDELSWELSLINSVIELPELYTDDKLYIKRYSATFVLISPKVRAFTKKKIHLKEVIYPEDAEKLLKYLNDKKKLKKLPFEEGNEWELKYSGFSKNDIIGKNWLEYRKEENTPWEFKKEGDRYILHHGWSKDNRVDSYLMTDGQYGSADEDLKVVYRFKTPEDNKFINDISVVFSCGPADSKFIPELTGYSICIAASENDETRIQRCTINMVDLQETLDLNTEYEVTVERIGGRISRKLLNLKTQKYCRPLEYIDSNAIYDKDGHIGFTTYSGKVTILGMEIYTRKSKFDISQFRLPLSIEVRLKGDYGSEKYFKVRVRTDIPFGEHQNVMLFEDVSQQRQAQVELENSHKRLNKLMGYLNSVREDESSRIAREVHDGLGQVLTAIQLDLTWLEWKLNPNQRNLKDKVLEILETVKSTIDMVQKITGELRPGVLDELGLSEAIEEEIDKNSKRSKIQYIVEIDIDESRLDRQYSLDLFRMIQESLTNISRHAQASRGIIKLKMIQDQIFLEISDNGKGITNNQINNPKSYGIIGLKERVFYRKGKLDIRGNKDKGTVISIVLPLET